MLDGVFEGQVLECVQGVVVNEDADGTLRRQQVGGVLDGGSLYRIEVFVDGKLKKTVNKQAPASDDLVIPVAEWFPVSVEEVLDRDCRPGT